MVTLFQREVCRAVCNSSDWSRQHCGIVADDW